jgi:hypothetical protein
MRSLPENFSLIGPTFQAAWNDQVNPNRGIAARAHDFPAWDTSEARRKVMEVDQVYDVVVRYLVLIVA